MITYLVRNVSEALYVTKEALLSNNRQIVSRNGTCYEFHHPVAVTYVLPCERVLFYPERNANPFFHLMESLWMLAGRNDVEWIGKYNGRMNDYSDDGKTFHGAYGFRWREWFGYDQLDAIVHRLKTYPNDRRCVLEMWDANSDLVYGNDGRDYPCNTHAYFQLRNGVLDLTVCCRSNDLIWGAYGANAVHFSFLQEYVSARIGARVGSYTQFSNNLHAYAEPLALIKDMRPDFEPYLMLQPEGLYEPVPLVDDPTTFDDELCEWVNNDSNRAACKYNNKFIPNVARPVKNAWSIYKSGDVLMALKVADTISSLDWRKACVEWLERKCSVKRIRLQDGPSPILAQEQTLR